MKLETKRNGATLPRRVAHGDVRHLDFDGYTFTLHAFESDGREVRISFERHEATRLGTYITEQLRKQRTALDELKRTTDQLYGAEGEGMGDDAFRS